MAGNEQAKEVKRLRREGYTVILDGQHHWAVYADKKRKRFLARFPMTSSNWRWLVNLRTDMRRRERQYAAEDVKT